METVIATDVRSSELEKLDRLVEGLPMDSPLAAALQAVVTSLRRGSDVVVAGQGDHFTPSQAAKVLRMSRTHLYKVMDAGELPFVRVGRDRRISAEDLFVFRSRRDQDRRVLAERFAHSSKTRTRAIAEVASLDSHRTSRAN